MLSQSHPERTPLWEYPAVRLSLAYLPTCGNGGNSAVQGGPTGHTSWTRQGTAAGTDQMRVLGGDASLACVRRGVVRTLQVTALPSESLRTAGPGSEGAGL